jgi:hypothetical protein
MEKRTTDIHHNLEAIKDVAISYAKEHQVNYNIILMNPDSDGKFTMGSTYEYVADSYFEKERPNVILLHKTDDLIKDEQNPENNKVDAGEWAKSQDELKKEYRDDGVGSMSMIKNYGEDIDSAWPRKKYRDRIEEVFNQFEENVIDRSHAISDLIVIASEAHVDGAAEAEEEFSLENESAEDMITELSDRDMLTQFEIYDWERIVLKHKCQGALIAENLKDEQKVELFEEAMGKYTLEELEKRLK